MQVQLSLDGSLGASASLKASLVFLSAASFAAYGTACFFSKWMKQEFARYGMARTRLWVGILQCAAAAGLLLGSIEPWLGRAASAGLALMMLVAVGVRIRIRDSLLETLPALFYLGLNAYLMLAAF